MILSSIDFESIEWQPTPSPGVYVYCIREKRRQGEEMPRFTAHAVRVDPGHEIGLHYHNREEGWVERLVFPNGGNFEFRRGDNINHYSDPTKTHERIKPYEIYAIKNRADVPLYLFSIMKPGFTGFGEIISVK